MNTPPPESQMPRFEVLPGVEPVYSNLARISHMPTEMTVDFARLTAGNPAAQVCARVIMSPVGAKLFLRALAENIARYEAAFGEITLPGDASLASALFRPPHPPEGR